MNQPRIQPIVEGVVSEKPQSHEEDKFESPTDDLGGDSPAEDEDEFGEKFEIPAFLRKIQ